MTKTWRDAKLPQWVRDGIEADRRALALKAALAWPAEARPEPVPFQWIDYDLLKGAAEDGLFWSCDFGGVAPVHIRKRQTGDAGYKDWRFSGDGVAWNSLPKRGPLFRTQRDAALELLWRKCYAAAADLLKAQVQS